MRGTFYNTLKYEGEKLIESMASCNRQEDLILEYFRQYDYRGFTPFEVWKSLFTPMVPITSVRRGITNLTDSGYLIKTDQQKTERYGKANYVWRYKMPDPEQINMFNIVSATRSPRCQQ